MPGLTGVVTATTLNVRPEPTTLKQPIGTLKRGISVSILDRAGGWFKIPWSGAAGYVHGDYLTIQDSNPAAGFFHEEDDLKIVPLPPKEFERIDVSSSFSPIQRLVARTWNSQGGLLEILSDRVGIEPATTVAVLCVESGGKGFNADGSMIIRFENHVFWREWGKTNAALFAAHFAYDQTKGWRDHKFREKSNGKWREFHGDQQLEWRVLEFARTLHDSAALRSISMGGPQIMGFNHARIGYDSVHSMFNTFRNDIRYQTIALFDFLQGPGTTSPMVVALQRKKFNDFASMYNGPGQAAMYGERIQTHAETFSSLIS
ncbi:MAG TPA: N-acetylmuramidase domain-containing protein [Bacteroidota bacterium]|nr:N-acetylmuramidase domain-containing protein [Bacteroidota bacterium]